MGSYHRYVVAVALGLLAAPAAMAAPPGNDEFANATAIASLPYFNVVDTFEATFADNDPGFCFTTDATVWYKFTPTVSGGVQVETAGSNYDTTLQVFKGAASDSLQLIGCSDDVVLLAERDSRVVFEAAANVTYYIAAGACCGQPGGILQLSVKSVPSPVAFDIEVSLAASGTLSSGAALISGMITCSSRAEQVDTFAVVTQSIGRTRKTSGFASVRFGPCNGTVPFTRLVFAEGTSFSKGKVGVTMSVNACAPNGCDGAQDDEIVTLSK